MLLSHYSFRLKYLYGIDAIRYYYSTFPSPPLRHHQQTEYELYTYNITTPHFLPSRTTSYLATERTGDKWMVG